MARSWWNRGRKRDLASLLRAERPEAPRDLVDELVSRIGGDRHERAVAPRASRRFAHAGVLTLVVVGGVASIGGIGYAASVVTHAAQQVKAHAVSTGRQMQAVSQIQTAALDQYGAPDTSTNVVKVVTQSGASGTLAVESPKSSTSTPSEPAVAIAVAWTSTTFATPVTISLDPTPPAATTSLFGDNNQSVSIVVRDPVTQKPIEVSNLAQPLEITFTNTAADFVPAYSKDGKSFEAIPLIANGGTTLPSDWADGYYRDAQGTVHVLTRHLTFFAVLFKANIQVGVNGKKLPAAGSGLFGDPTRNLAGSPILKKVGTVALKPKPVNGATFVPLTFFVSEQAATYFNIVDASGNEIMLSRKGSTVRGTTLTGKNMKTIHIVVLRPGTLNVGVRTARPLKLGQEYKLRIAAVDIDGNKTVSFVPFTAQRTTLGR